MFVCFWLRHGLTPLTILKPVLCLALQSCWKTNPCHRANNIWFKVTDLKVVILYHPTRFMEYIGSKIKTSMFDHSKDSPRPSLFLMTVKPSHMYNSCRFGHLKISADYEGGSALALMIPWLFLNRFLPCEGKNLDWKQQKNDPKHTSNWFCNTL